MNMQRPGPNRAARRRGSNPRVGGPNADDHFHELIGSNSFWIYLTPNKRLKGFETLQEQVESHGCSIGFADDAPVDAGKGYQALKIAARGDLLLPVDVLKLAHRWAHRHNFLHSFFKPTFRGLI
ncbi:MAG TPA: hypothetical protein VFC51_01410 [Chloroflexota bacterium]|nr:hypothetical protein [Chloroflexota bacterium]